MRQVVVCAFLAIFISSCTGTSSRDQNAVEHKKNPKNTEPPQKPVDIFKPYPDSPPPSGTELDGQDQINNRINEDLPQPNGQIGGNNIPETPSIPGATPPPGSNPPGSGGLGSINMEIPESLFQPNTPSVPEGPSGQQGPSSPETPNVPPGEYSADVSCKKKQFTKVDIDNWVAKSGAASGSIKYVYIDLDYLNNPNDNFANLARVGAFKALFHSSFTPTVEGFADVSEGHCAVYKVDLQKIWGGDWQKNWDIVASSQPQPDSSFDRARQPHVKPSGQEVQDFAKGVISAKRLAYQITYPTNYLELLKVPSSVSRIEQGRSLAVGGYEDGIPCGPRVLVVRESTLAGQKVLYFMSGDPGSRGEQGETFSSSPPRSAMGSGFPRVQGRRISGSESIRQLPNGLLQYFVWRNPGSRGTKALRSGVIDPANPHNGFTLVAGRSCIACHNNGIRGVPPDTVSKGNGWSDGNTFEQYFTSARQKYFEAMRQIVVQVSSASAEYNQKLVMGRTMEPVAFLINQTEEASLGSGDRRSAPYTRCRKPDGSDKFRDQIKNLRAAVGNELQVLNSPGSKPGQGSTPGTPQGSTPPSQPSPQPLNGQQLFTANCASSGCHGSPSQDSRLRGVTNIPNRMITQAGLDASRDAAKIQAIESYLRGGS